MAEHWQELCKLSSRGAGVFITVNETNGKGRKVADIIRVRAVFQECDRPGSPEPPLQPHIVVESSPGKYHRYLLVDGGHRFDLFEQVMARLVADFGSDPNAKDRARVLRLPGFPHQKTPANPRMVRLIHESGEQPYTWEAITATIPPLLLEKTAAAIPAGKGIDNPAKVRSALAALNPDMEYLPWLQVGMALHHATAGGAEGLALWDEWSARGTSYHEGETAQKWRSFGSCNGTPVTLASVFKLATAAGWRWQDPPAESLKIVTPPTGKGAPAQGPTAGKPKDRDLPKIEIYTAIDLAAMEFPPIRWAVEDVLPAGTTILAGPPKMGKTRLAFNIAFGIAVGGVVLGGIPVEKGEVLYSALDDPKRRLKDMLVATAEQNKIPIPMALHFAFTWPRVDQGGAEILDGWLAKHPDCRLIVIDVLKYFRPIQLGKNFYAEDYAVGDALKPIAEKHNVAMLGNHHTNKTAYRIEEGDDPIQAISGTSGLPGGFDNTLVLYRQRGQADAFLHICGNDTALADKALVWDDQLLSWRIAGAAEEFAGSKEMLVILAKLRECQPATPVKLARHVYPEKTITNKSPEYFSVKKLLRMATLKGRCTTRDGLYEISGISGISGISTQNLQRYREIPREIPRENSQVTETERHSLVEIPEIPKIPISPVSEAEPAEPGDGCQDSPPVQPDAGTGTTDAEPPAATADCDLVDFDEALGVQP